MSTDAEQYLDSAVRFRARPSCISSARPIRVADTLLTCGTAAALLNEMALPAEANSMYCYVNVHNPFCPLFFDAKEGGWACKAALADHPVCGINWAGARLICQHLGGRLPLQREWERFASNNDPGRKYPWGNAPATKALANFGEHFGGTSNVRHFPPSDLGLYDLAGNLGEWCQDSFDAGGGQEPLFEKVVKGGAWSKDARYLDIVMSRGKWARLGTTTIGIRPVWDD